MKTLAALCFISFVFVVEAGEPTGRYKKVVDELSLLQQKYKTLSQVFSIGQNGEGTEIYALRISTTPSVVDPKKVGHIIVSTHHGDESAAPLFTLYLIDQLLKRYSSNELFRGDLANTEWTLIPVLNATGYNANQRRENDKDPNRDYQSPCTSHPGGALKSVAQLVKLLTARIYSGSVTVHGYHGSLTYPWGLYTTNTHSLDHNLFQQITAKAAALNGYRYGTASDIVYPANGCYEDYAYWKHGLWSLLLELKNGSTDDIQKTTLAIFSFFDQLDSSPSLKHQFNGSCTRENPVDLRLE